MSTKVQVIHSITLRFEKLRTNLSTEYGVSKQKISNIRKKKGYKNHIASKGVIIDIHIFNYPDSHLCGPFIPAPTSPDNQGLHVMAKKKKKKKVPFS